METTLIRSFLTRIFITITLFFISVAITLPGCATRQTFKPVQVDPHEMKSFLSDKPSALKKSYQALLEEGARNEVLNNMQIGIDALQMGYRENAVSSFDLAIKGITTVYANNEVAKKARTLWYEEQMKEFKGEPYERAMAFYYRGVLYLEDGDYENARACFKSGINQDAFAEEEQNRCDFALLIFLSAVASGLSGDDYMADLAMEELKTLRPDFDQDLSGNALVLFETGTSPRKLGDGPGHSELKFRRGKGAPEQTVEIAVNNTDFKNVYPMESIFWQSTSRGGRFVDKILEGKAQFRQVHSEIGSTLADISSTGMLISPLFDNSGNMAGASAALGLLAVTEMAIAQSSRPHADIRYWNNLPDTVHVMLMDLSAGNHSFDIRYRDNKGNLIPKLDQKIEVNIQDDQFNIVQIASRKR